MSRGQVETIKESASLNSITYPAEKVWDARRLFSKFAGFSIVLFYVVFFLAWELYGRTVSPLVFSYPSAIIKAGAEMVRSGELFSSLIISLSVLMQGLFLSILFGIVIGFGLGRYTIIRRIFSPIINTLYIAPREIFIPLLVVWFGLTETSKVILLVLASVFPVIYDVTDGVRSVSRVYVEVARAYGANEWQIVKEVTFPSILPFIGAGVKNAIARGLTGLIVAEFFIGATGIGGLLQRVSAVYRIDKSFVIVFVLVIIGFVLTKTGEYVESYLGRWRETERAF